MDVPRRRLLVTAATAVSALLVPSVPSAYPAATATAPAAPEAIDPDVLKLREAAWRAFFAGDDAALGRMLPPDFIGLNMADGPFVTRDEALTQARSFRASGGRLVSLEFPETRAQRYGDVMVLYGRFAVVLESGAPERTTQTFRGRLTEVFRREGKGWVHPGWHLDTASP